MSIAKFTNKKTTLCDFLRTTESFIRDIRLKTETFKDINNNKQLVKKLSNLCIKIMCFCNESQKQYGLNYEFTFGIPSEFKYNSDWKMYADNVALCILDISSLIVLATNNIDNKIAIFFWNEYLIFIDISNGKEKCSEEEDYYDSDKINKIRSDFIDCSLKKIELICDI